MVDYVKSKALADRLITENGQAVTIVRESNNYDPTQASQTPVTENYSGYGVVFPYKEGESSISGTVVENAELYMLLSCDERPKIQDVHTIKGRDWRVIRFDPFEPNGTTIYYEVYLAK